MEYDETYFAELLKKWPDDRVVFSLPGPVAGSRTLEITKVDAEAIAYGAMRLSEFCGQIELVVRVQKNPEWNPIWMEEFERIEKTGKVERSVRKYLPIKMLQFLDLKRVNPEFMSEFVKQNF